MRRECVVALSLVFVASSGAGQSQSASATSEPAIAQAAASTVYYAGPDVTAPELLPMNGLTFVDHRCKKFDGTIELAAVVDASGQARQMTFLRPLGSDLDKLALRILEADRFKPGMHNGVPAAVGISIEVRLQSCIEHSKNDEGKDIYTANLRSEPSQSLQISQAPPEGMRPTLRNSALAEQGVAQIGQRYGVTAPVPLNSVQAVFSDYGRSQKINGVCLVKFIVDVNGMPQNARVIKSLEASMDRNAIEAVYKYRFKPALKNGEPVPVMLTVRVDFKIY
jgi:TonB family protein